MAVFLGVLDSPIHEKRFFSLDQTSILPYRCFCLEVSAILWTTFAYRPKTWFCVFVYGRMRLQKVSWCVILQSNNVIFVSSFFMAAGCSWKLFNFTTEWWLPGVCPRCGSSNQASILPRCAHWTESGRWWRGSFRDCFLRTCRRRKKFGTFMVYLYLHSWGWSSFSVKGNLVLRGSCLIIVSGKRLPHMARSLCWPIPVQNLFSSYSIIQL